jgi:hypothetical protein
MTSKVPYTIDQINVDNICYTDIKSTDKKTIIYLKYMDRNKLKNIVFQTPNLLSVYNVKEKDSITTLDVPLVGKSDNKIAKFVHFLNSIDNKIIKDAKTNSKWFKLFSHHKTMKYQKIIRESEDPQYSDGIIRFKILKTNDFNTIVQINNKKVDPMVLNNDPERLSNNHWVKSILEIYAIWINDNGFGLFIRPILMDFKMNQSIAYNYKMIDSSEGDDIDDGLCTIQDNTPYKIIQDTVESESVFIKSENDLVASIVELPPNSDIPDNKTSSDKLENIQVDQLSTTPINNLSSSISKSSAKSKKSSTKSKNSSTKSKNSSAKSKNSSSSNESQVLEKTKIELESSSSECDETAHELGMTTSISE